VKDATSYREPRSRRTTGFARQVRSRQLKSAHVRSRQITSDHVTSSQVKSGQGTCAEDRAESSDVPASPDTPIDGSKVSLTCEIRQQATQWQQDTRWYAVSGGCARHGEGSTPWRGEGGLRTPWRGEGGQRSERRVCERGEER
jgi:hypothetical protein